MTTATKRQPHATPDRAWNPWSWQDAVAYIIKKCRETGTTAAIVVEQEFDFVAERLSEEATKHFLCDSIERHIGRLLSDLPRGANRGAVYGLQSRLTGGETILIQRISLSVDGRLVGGLNATVEEWRTVAEQQERRADLIALRAKGHRRIAQYLTEHNVIRARELPLGGMELDEIVRDHWRPEAEE